MNHLLPKTELDLEFSMFFERISSVMETGVLLKNMYTTENKLNDNGEHHNIEVALFHLQ
jgi:hypothetical protein